MLYKSTIDLVMRFIHIIHKKEEKEHHMRWVLGSSLVSGYLFVE